MQEGEIFPIHDKDFIHQWLKTVFVARLEIFTLLLKAFQNESDNTKKSNIRAKIFQETQGHLEDLSMLITALKERNEEITKKGGTEESLLQNLLNVNTNMKYFDTLMDYVQSTNVEKIIHDMGLPGVGQNPPAWGAKQSNWKKTYLRINEEFRVIAAHIAGEKRIGRRMGNKLKHFGFFQPYNNDGSVDVWVEAREGDRGLSDSRIGFTHWVLPPDLSVDEEAFHLAHKLIERILTAYLATK